MEGTTIQLNQEIMDLIFRFCKAFKVPPNTIIIDYERGEKLFEEEIEEKGIGRETAKKSELLRSKNSYGDNFNLFLVKNRDTLKVGLVGDKNYFDEIEKENKILAYHSPDTDDYVCCKCYDPKEDELTLDQILFDKKLRRFCVRCGKEIRQ